MKNTEMKRKQGKENWKGTDLLFSNQYEVLCVCVCVDLGKTILILLQMLIRGVFLETLARSGALEGREADLAFDGLGGFVRLQLTLRLLLRVLSIALTLLCGFGSVSTTHG